MHWLIIFLLLLSVPIFRGALLFIILAMVVGFLIISILTYFRLNLITKGTARKGPLFKEPKRSSKKSVFEKGADIEDAEFKENKNP